MVMIDRGGGDPNNARDGVELRRVGRGKGNLNI